jgi:hypothetical protein
MEFDVFGEYTLQQCTLGKFRMNVDGLELLLGQDNKRSLNVGRRT